VLVHYDARPCHRAVVVVHISGEYDLGFIAVLEVRELHIDGDARALGDGALAGRQPAAAAADAAAPTAAEPIAPAPAARPPSHPLKSDAVVPTKVKARTGAQRLHSRHVADRQSIRARRSVSLPYATTS